MAGTGAGKGSIGFQCDSTKQISTIGDSKATKAGKSTALKHFDYFRVQWNQENPSNIIPSWDEIPEDMWTLHLLKAFGRYLAEDACKGKTKRFLEYIQKTGDDDEEELLWNYWSLERLCNILVVS